MPDPAPRTKTTFYRDTLDDVLYRLGASGIPEILDRDGQWRFYPGANLQTGAMPTTREGAHALAGNADLDGPGEPLR